MLETRELQKIYKPKKGVPVVALDNVSLKFPDKGMVFLLGKSGSGKSTLLNLLGGLDKYDGGEIIINGVSSKDFKQQSFDSYRNTYVGFIFQEYNVLDEFTVGANIALAIELQGRKATDEEINEILKEVDLEGYGNRKPNELSGGQKQRVAIARALIKKPEIIMADEPTGALDSNTGRQVFDTLKKLSKEKLVIIVSHDREFSEQYADRIIELADGKVISDVELAYDQSYFEEAEEEKIVDSLVYSGDTIEVPVGYHLTEEDRIAINAYIDQHEHKQAIQLKLPNNKKISNKKFVQTKQDNIKNESKGTFELIKSKLPLKNAFKIGASGLKYKKFRLVMTILLSFVAFTLFGLADTLSSYNHIEACTNSVKDSNVSYLSLIKSKRIDDKDGAYYDSWMNFIFDEEMEEIEKKLGIDFEGVYTPIASDMWFSENINTYVSLTETDFTIDSDRFSGYAEIGEEELNKLGYTILAGKLPDGSKKEIAISEYICKIFMKTKYTDGVTVNDKGVLVYEEIKNYGDMVGKTLTFDGEKYTVTGVVDTKFDYARYETLIKKNERMSSTEEIARYALYNEFYYASEYSLSSVAIVGEGFLEEYIKGEPNKHSIYNDMYVSLYTDKLWVDPYYMSTIGDVKDLDIKWLGEEKTELGEKEVIVSSDLLYGDGEYLDIEDESVINMIKGLALTANIFNYSNESDIYEDGYKIVGIIDVSKEANEKYLTTMVVNQKMFDRCSEIRGKYNYIIGSMPETEDEIRAVVEATMGSQDDIRYEIQNAVTYELDTINSALKVISKICLYVGIGFAVFASLMLANFIGTSISYKKQEIGILRAIGARSNDVFRIFFSESFIIAMINFILATVATYGFTTLINVTLREELLILVTVLDFDIRQVLLLFVISMGVAALASFLPVKKIASKRPIDAIRNR